MKNISFFLLITVLFQTVVFSQIDATSGGNTQGTISTFASEKTTKKPTKVDINDSNGFKNAYKKEQEALKKKQQENAINNKGILSEAKAQEERFLKAFKKINGQYQYPKINQDLGSVRTNAASVNIICRDFQYPDGDRVTIYVNDIPLIANIVLTQHYQRFNIPLEIGMNKISFKALNQGTSGPNTAAFKVFNDAGMLLSSNEWNLATGAIATIIVAKDK